MGGRIRVVLVCTLLAGCDDVFHLHHLSEPPDAPSNDLQCATRTALMCADFEAGTAYYANGIRSEVTPQLGNVTATVDAPGAVGGHALYIDSTGDLYRLDARGTTAVSRITATFSLELSRFATSTQAMSLAVLYFEQVQTSSCYVALDFQPTPMRLTLVSNCTTQTAHDLVIPLPSQSVFVPVTLDIDLSTNMGTAHVGANMASALLDPGGSTTGIPGVAIGFIDAPGSAGARVGFDDLVVVTAP